MEILKEERNDTTDTFSETLESSLKRINEGRLAYKTSIGTFYVLGSLSADLGTLKASIHFEEENSKRKYRDKPDLYIRSQLLTFAKTISEAESIDIKLVESELIGLTDLLETYRENLLVPTFGQKNKMINLLSPEKEKEAIEFLMRPSLIQNIDNLIETSGIVGEENNRMMLFVIASTYKMLNPLHGLIQGTSGNGKTHLITAIANLMPQEDVLSISRITSKSLYNYRGEELVNKLLVIQDIEGLDEEALYAFREMQSAGFVSSSTTRKDNLGQLSSIIKRVDSKFASMVATTHAEIYYDNLSRSIVMGVNEGEEQTYRIIEYQNRKTAGKIDLNVQKEAKDMLQNCMRTLKPYEVLNPYADQFKLPVEAKMLRRLNQHYQDFVKQITILHQYQRKKDKQGRLISTKEDLQLSCEILFDAIVWKIDELDSSLRQFFERLKDYVRNQNSDKNNQFTTKEIRQEFNLSSSQVDRFVQDLKRLDYIQISGGSANKGYKYKISHWDDMDKIRQRIKSELMNQIDNIESE